MAKGTFTVAGQRVRVASQRRYVAFICVRRFDGVNYGDPVSVQICKRSDNLGTVETYVQRQGFHSSRFFVIIDTTTGEEA